MLVTEHQERRFMTHNQIEYWKYREGNRHNIVTENETRRHNVVGENIDLGKLNESIRHNKATESIGWDQNAIERGKLSETQRHNQATEYQGLRDLDIKSASQAEQVRHNQASERLTGTDLNIKAENVQETQRHNVASEGIESSRAESYATQAESQAEVNRANKALTDVQTTWAGLLNSGQLDLTQSQIEEIDARIDKYAAEIARANSDITRNAFQNANDTARTVFSGIQTLSQEVNRWAGNIALIKG